MAVKLFLPFPNINYIPGLSTRVCDENCISHFFVSSREDNLTYGMLHMM